MYLKCCYSFPDRQKNPEMYALWLEKVNKDAPVRFVPGKESRLCSKHFSSDMFKEGKKKSYFETQRCPNNI